MDETQNSGPQAGHPGPGATSPAGLSAADGGQEPESASPEPTAGPEPAEGRDDVGVAPEPWKIGGESGNPWVGQLQQMIDNIATQARPVVLEVMAKAAELTSVAAEHAGPVAQRAANVTGEVSQKVATRTKEWAGSLRQQQGRGPGPGA